MSEPSDLSAIDARAAIGAKQLSPADLPEDVFWIWPRMQVPMIGSSRGWKLSKRLIPLTHPDQHIVVQRDGVEGPAGNEESVSGLYFG